MVYIETKQGEGTGLNSNRHLALGYKTQVFKQWKE